MQNGTQRRSLADQILHDFEVYGILPHISGGDDDATDGNKDDSDATSSGKSGEESTKKTGGSEDSGKFKPITSQEDLDAVIIKRLRRQEKSLREEITEDIKASLKAEADAAAAKEQGDFKALYEAEVKKVESLQKKLDEKDAEVKQKTLDELRAEVIAEFKLPEDLADRLRGETKDELKADAKKLSEVVVPREAPDTDAGKSNADIKKTRKTNQEDVKDPNYWGLPS